MRNLNVSRYFYIFSTLKCFLSLQRKFAFEAVWCVYTNTQRDLTQNIQPTFLSCQRARKTCFVWIQVTSCLCCPGINFLIVTNVIDKRDIYLHPQTIKLDKISYFKYFYDAIRHGMPHPRPNFSFQKL